ncbi:sulfatase [Pontiella sulfatireligans]|uniref:Choline-sulfatase n=1 Tax=Pontiella sulfatireligans TaxID=2750658 RepID=A0A6C2UGG4_9BACT|nr:sulfatase [Pontiella sulfatireligans]SPS74282.1 sulfatase S1_7 [Kiritimatiellales bacterium]VGO19009.1 Choline-sulfatase [Pontiella sulfatireligans]
MRKQSYIKRGLQGRGFLVGLLVFAGGIFFSVRADEVPPNVVLIVVDDLNDWSDSFGGYADAKMPNLDRLAASGMKFNNAHCTAPACSPSRTSFLSGLLPSTTGHYANGQGTEENLRLKTVTFLNQYFSERGYETHRTGKVYHGDEPFPVSEWDSSRINISSPLPPTEDRPLHGISSYSSTTTFDWGVIDKQAEDMAEYRCATFVLNKLEQYETDPDPFFIACGFYNPHLPWFAPQEYFDRFPLEEISLPITQDNDQDDVPEIGRTHRDHDAVVAAGKWKEGVQGYLAACAVTDDAIGRILDGIDAHPKKNNTIVVLITDHGWHLGEKQTWRKFTLWEESTRTPMVWVVPGVTAAGQVCDKPVSLLDLYPTLTDLCGLPDNPENEGNSLAPLLGDPSADWDHVSITEDGYKCVAARDERWRYIRYIDGSEELYDHDVDPMEWTNIASQVSSQSVIDRLSARLPKRYAEPSDDRETGAMNYDFWKAATGGGALDADSDGDSITDWYEFVAGSDPLVSDKDESLEWAGAITADANHWNFPVTRDGSHTGAPPILFSYDLETWYHGGVFSNDNYMLPVQGSHGFVRFLQDFPEEGGETNSVNVSTAFDGVKYDSITAAGLDAVTTGGSWVLNTARGATFALEGLLAADLALLMDDEVNVAGDEFFARLDFDTAFSLTGQSVEVDFNFLIRRYGAGKGTAFELRDSSDGAIARFEWSSVDDRIYLNNVDVGGEHYYGGSNWGSESQLPNQRSLSFLVGEGDVTVDYDSYGTDGSDGTNILVSSQALLGTAADLKSLVILSSGTTDSKEGVYLDDVTVQSFP